MPVMLLYHSFLAFVDLMLRLLRLSYQFPLGLVSANASLFTGSVMTLASIVPDQASFLRPILVGALVLVMPLAMKAAAKQWLNVRGEMIHDGGKGACQGQCQG